MGIINIKESKIDEIIESAIKVLSNTVDIAEQMNDVLFDTCIDTEKDLSLLVGIASPQCLNCKYESIPCELRCRYRLCFAVSIAVNYSKGVKAVEDYQVIQESYSRNFDCDIPDARAELFDTLNSLLVSSCIENRKDGK